MGQERENQYQALVGQMEKLCSEESFGSVEELYQQAVFLKDEKIEPYYYRLFALYSQKEYDMVISFGEEILSKHGFHSGRMEADFRFILGNAYYEKKEYIDAVNILREALDINDKNGEIYRDYAVALAHLGDMQGADEALQAAINLGVESDSVYFVKGEIELLRKEYKLAESSLLQCIETTEDEYRKMRAYLLCGEVYDSAFHETSAVFTDDYGDRNELLRKKDLLLHAKQTLPINLGLAIYESLAQAYIDCGNYYTDSGYYMEAIEVLNNEIANGWGNYDTYYNLAVLYQMTGDTTAAFHHLKNLLDQFGEDYVIYKRLAFLEADIQSAFSNEDRDYYQFVGYYKRAFELYDSADTQRTDNEMQLLASVYEQLRNGGWINE